MLPMIKNILIFCCYVCFVGGIVLLAINGVRKKILQGAPVFKGIAIAMATILGVFRQAPRPKENLEEGVVRSRIKDSVP